MLRLDMVLDTLVESDLEIPELEMLLASGRPPGVVSHLFHGSLHVPLVNLNLVNVILSAEKERRPWSDCLKHVRTSQWIV